MIDFEKWHGLGNDFVVVRADALSPDTPSSRFVAWCERRRGIGADGVLVLSSETADGFTLDVVNRDGSTPEICGNGTRCAVRSWAARQDITEGRVDVQTGAGLKRCRFDPSGQVTVDMGPARLVDACLPPHNGPTNALELPVRLGDQSYTGLAVSMGNPHLVIFAPEWAHIEADDAARLEHLPYFPNRVNVSFATEPHGGRIALRVWERGVGLTEACGSAACATAVAAVTTGRVGAETPVTVTLPGGDLAIRVSADLQTVEKTGPAEFVYAGSI